MKLEFDYKQDKEYSRASRQNEGKYDVNMDGLLILKNGVHLGDGYGYLFPTIDPDDPKAGAKIMESFFMGMFANRQLSEEAE